MSDRSYALWTGLFIVVLGATIVAAFLWIGGRHPPTRPYVVVTTGSVFGLRPASTVFYRGMEAGVVRSIALDPSNPEQIYIGIAVNKGIPITQGTYGQLRFQGITGLMALELNSTKNRRPLLTSKAHPAHIPMRPSLLDEIDKYASKTVARLASLTEKLNLLLNATNRQKFGHVLANMAAVSRQWRVISAHLATASVQLPALARQGRRTLARLDAVGAHFIVLSRRLNVLVTMVQTAGNKVLARTLPEIDRTIEQMRITAADVDALSRSLHRNPQQLLLGAPRRRPGPGEPGYKGGAR